jgi:prepilin signal peptidase PulO-like enzyme (type II secretory pathway)
MEQLPLLIAFFFGAIVASFAGVVAERLHTGESWVRGRSHCNSCGRTLSVLDLLPVLSYLLFWGRCRTCGGRVPATYPVIEAFTGFAFAIGYASFGFSLPFPFFLLSFAVLAFIVYYDLRHTVIPRTASVLLIVFALLFSWVGTTSVVHLGEALLTAGIIGGGLFLFHALSKGRAMGLADAPLAFALSLLVAPYAVAGILFSFWIGGIWGIGVLVTRRGGPKMGIEVPFAPFLAAGFLLAYFIQWNPLVF